MIAPERGRRSPGSHQLGTLVDDVASRRSAFYAAARWQAEAGNADGTIDFLQAMKDADASTRAYVLAVAAGEQAKAGDIPGDRVTMARADADAEHRREGTTREGARSRSCIGCHAARPGPGNVTIRSGRGESG